MQYTQLIYKQNELQDFDRNKTGPKRDSQNRTLDSVDTTRLRLIKTCQLPNPELGTGLVTAQRKSNGLQHRGK